VSEEPDIHSVFEEPHMRSRGDAARRYGAWLDEGFSTTPARARWRVALLLALSAGPWAVVAALWSGSGAIGGAFAVVVFGPLAEEVAKVAAVLWAVERRPFWFASRGAIVGIGAMAGLAFAAIENLLYLEVYIPDPSPGIVLWRWTVCVALHVGCAVIASLGVARVWRRAVSNRARPELTPALGFIVAAAVIHGAYNAAALTYAALGDPI